MRQNKHGEMIFSQDDICDLLMQGQDLAAFEGMFVDRINLEDMSHVLDNVPAFVEYDRMCQEDLTTEAYDHRCQQVWFMPDEYRNMDIAKWVLDQCKTEEELQRVGKELLLYQERDLFFLLKQLKYIVDVWRDNNIVWGVGRGSSVSSYILYLIGVHKIDSIYYDLDVHEFLR